MYIFRFIDKRFHGPDTAKMSIANTGKSVDAEHRGNLNIILQNRKAAERSIIYCHRRVRRTRLSFLPCIPQGQIMVCLIRKSIRPKLRDKNHAEA